MVKGYTRSMGNMGEENDGFDILASPCMPGGNVLTLKLSLFARKTEKYQKIFFLHLHI